MSQSEIFSIDGCRYMYKVSRRAQQQPEDVLLAFRYKSNNHTNVHCQLSGSFAKRASAPIQIIEE